MGDVSAEGQIDVKVQALIGYSTQISRGLYSSQFGEAYYYVFTVVKTSDWSNIQTISIPSGVVSISPSQNPITSPTISHSQDPIATPQQPDVQSGVLFGLDWEQIAIIFLGIAVVVLATVLVISRRRSTNKTQASPKTSVPL